MEGTSGLKPLGDSLFYFVPNHSLFWYIIYVRQTFFFKLVCSIASLIEFSIHLDERVQVLPQIMIIRSVLFNLYPILKSSTILFKNMMKHR